MGCAVTARFRDRTSRNGPTAPPRPELDTGLKDALADLRDWTTDKDTGQVASAVAGETLAGLHHLYQRGDTSRVLQAYAGLTRLEERNGKRGPDNLTLLPDIAQNRHRCGKDFFEIVSYLKWRIEDDWHKELQQALRGFAR